MSKLTVSISYLDSTRCTRRGSYLAPYLVPRLNSQARPISYLALSRTSTTVKSGATAEALMGVLMGKVAVFGHHINKGSRFGGSGRARFDGEKQL